MPIALPDLLDEQQVILRLRSRKPANAIREIVQSVAHTGRIANTGAFLEQLLARERTHSSVVQNGVVFPHVRTDLVDEIVIGIGRSRAGIPFGKDQQRAHLIFVIGVPERMVGDYLICVGTLARLVRDETTHSTLLSVETPREFIDALTGGNSVAASLRDAQTQGLADKRTPRAAKRRDPNENAFF
jgi:mannitol/fructose-specific phosphotransferase system IIA component (Ntr-type)